MPIQAEMIELKGDGFWMLVNRRDIKLIQLDPLPVPYLNLYKIIIFYYGEDEPMLTLDQKFTKEQCETFIYNFSRTIA